MYKRLFHEQFLCGFLALMILLFAKVPFTLGKTQNTFKAVKPDRIIFKDTLTEYTINAKFDDTIKTFMCAENIKFTNTYHKNLNSLSFHLYVDSYNNLKTMPNLGGKRQKLRKIELGDINITKVFIENNELPFTQDNQVLKVKLINTINPYETVNIKVNFTLKIPMGQNRLGYYNNVYSITNWYPIIAIYDIKNNTWDETPFHPTGESNYSDIANYKVSIDVPNNMILASTGITVSNKNNEKSRRIYNITAEKVRDFVFIMSPNFSIITKKVNDVTFNSFYLPDGTKETNERASELLNLAIDSFNFFSNTFGKYPYKEFDTVETHVEGFAMEYPQLIQMGKYSPNYTGQIGFLEEATVHEVGHQWWYVTVGNNEFKNSFLDESLNSFSTAYYFEKKYGKYSSCSVNIALRNRMNLFKGCLTPINTPVDKIKNEEFGKLIYGMGALVFENLRKNVGEDKLLSILKTYYSRNEFKNATLDDLLAIIEELGGKNAKNQVVADINIKGFYPKHLALTKAELDEYRKQK